MNCVNQSTDNPEGAQEKPELIQKLSMSLFETDSVSRIAATAFSPNAYMQNASSRT